MKYCARPSDELMDALLFSANVEVVHDDDESSHNGVNNVIGGVVTTYAGTGASGGTGSAGAYADGIATSTAEFYFPEGVSVDSTGNVIVGDRYNNRVRKISTAGMVSTLAGSGAGASIDGIGTTAAINCPIGIAFSTTGLFIYIADNSGCKIRSYASSGRVCMDDDGGGIGIDHEDRHGGDYHEDDEATMAEYCDKFGSSS